MLTCLLLERRRPLLGRAASQQSVHGRDWSGNFLFLDVCVLRRCQSEMHLRWIPVQVMGVAHHPTIPSLTERQLVDETRMRQLRRLVDRISHSGIAMKLAWHWKADWLHQFVVFLFG